LPRQRFYYWLTQSKKSTKRHNNFHILPKSAFGRISLLIGVLLMVNQIVTYISVSVFTVRPQFQPVIHLVSKQIQGYAFQVKNVRDPKIVNRYKKAIGLSVFTQKQLPEAFRLATQYESLSEDLSRKLGSKAIVRLQDGDSLVAWVQLPETSAHWMRLELGEIKINAPNLLIVYLAVITLLSIAGGWAFARQISRPLKRLEFAAKEIGRGDIPGDLREEGTEELVAVTRAFNQMAKDVQQLEEDRSLLLAGISHDLRTPITRIRLSTEFMFGEELDEIKEGIISDIEDMDSIIDQFISYVRDGRDELPESHNINELVDQIASAVTRNERNVELKLGDIPSVRFRPLALKRVITNLMENAFRYASDDIIAETWADKSMVYCAIKDHGKGVKESDIPRLLQPFARGDSARGGQGSGLGLAIVKRIIDMHHGVLIIQNRRQEAGLEVRIGLPLN
jgi:two-component system, OmpR family, osmolarity sensor histidine kinase EnvZ